MTVELALDGGLRLLVCGNRLPFYDIAYELARRVGQHYERILKEQIFFSRAETCFQLVDFLSELDADQADPTPLIISDFLSRFSNEGKRQVDSLFFQCQVELQRLSQRALVFISAKPRPPCERLWHALNRITQPLNRTQIAAGTQSDKDFTDDDPIILDPCCQRRAEHPQNPYTTLLGDYHGPYTTPLLPSIQTRTRYLR